MTELNINGYIVTEELRSENAGNSSYGFAIKDGKKYFIKQLKETYYDISYDKATAFQREDMELSQLFYERIVRLFTALRKADNGNIVVPIEFIRKDGHYYIVSEWVDQFGEFSEIKNFTPFNKHLMMKVLAYSLCGLSEHHIVHCDLKPDNIRIKATINKTKTLKIIDFDNGFIEGEYPSMIGGSQTYMAPEVVMRIRQEENEIEDKIPITSKADIFSLGIIFHEILVGVLPQNTNPNYEYLGVAVGYGDRILLSNKISNDYAKLIHSMLLMEPTQRPDALTVFKTLSVIDPMRMSVGR